VCTPTLTRGVLEWYSKYVAENLYEYVNTNVVVFYIINRYIVINRYILINRYNVINKYIVINRYIVINIFCNK
jgi:hypothetical protein